MVGIVVFLRQLLSLDKALMDLGEDLIAVVEKGVRSLCAHHPRPIWQDRRRGTAVHHFVGRGAESCVEGGVAAIYSAHDSQSTHTRGRSPVTQRKYIAITLFTTSDCPSVWG